MTKEPISMDKEYVTSDGCPVRIYATDVEDTYSVHAAYYAEGKWWMQNYTKHGQISAEGPDDYLDLIEKPKDTADYIEELEAELDAANNKLAKAVEALQDAKRLKDEALKVACQLPRHSIAKHDLQLAADLFELKEEAIQELTGGKDE